MQQLVPGTSTFLGELFTGNLFLGWRTMLKNIKNPINCQFFKSSLAQKGKLCLIVNLLTLKLRLGCHSLWI